MSVSCDTLNYEDINSIFSKILYEFLIEKINIRLPRWISSLELDNELRTNILNSTIDSFNNVRKIRDINIDNISLKEIEEVKDVKLDNIDLANGIINISVDVKDELFYEMLTKTTGIEIKNESELFTLINEFSKIKKEYDKMSYAIHEVNEKGYGIVTPTIDDLILEEPEIVKQGQKFGVKLKAKAPSIHMIKIDTETEVSPIVGSDKQSEDLVRYLLSEFEENPKKIWESNIFGKSLHELVNEGLQNKLARMPEDAQLKLQDTLQRIVNEGSGGLICILL